MKQGIAFAAIILAPFSSIAGTLQQGSYHCNGYDPINESEYSGYATISKTNSVYQMTWDFGKKQSFEGVALIHPEEDDILAVSFRDKNNTKKSGVKVYEVDGDQLKGHWVMLGHKTTGTEECKKVEE